jgi:hypothetical protein
MNPSSSTSRAVLLVALFAPLTTFAVSLSTDGLGQALIYPYYTVQSTEGNAFNTYVSITNQGSSTKALRVRFREGRMGKEALGFNLFLMGGDTWTGAVLPNSAGARLITRDASCTDPAFTPDSAGVTYVDFRNAAFSGSGADGAGEGLDRTREGYVEFLEMGTLLDYADYRPLAPGTGQDCASIRARTPAVSSPDGNLGGTLALLNVATGVAFSLQAEALTALASRPYFRPSSDPYPDFNAVEIDPVSVVIHEGAVYRSAWPRPEDAVSAVLMGYQHSADFVLDRSTASVTDVVAVLPTRRLYGNTGPFTQTPKWSPDCAKSGSNGEWIAIWWYDREARQTMYNAECGDLGCFALSAPNDICAAAGVAPVRRAATPGGSTVSDVLGSRTLGLAKAEIVLPERAENGRIELLGASTAAVRGSFQSLPSSLRFSLSTGEVTTAAHRYYGIPMIGAAFFVYRNGTLRCGTQLCQGTFGSVSPMRPRRLVEIRPIQ